MFYGSSISCIYRQIVDRCICFADKLMFTTDSLNVELILLYISFVVPVGVLWTTSWLVQCYAELSRTEQD